MNPIYIHTEPIDEWTLPYVYRPQASNKIKSSGPFGFQLRFDSIYMKLVFQQPKHVEVIKEFQIAKNWGLGFFQTDKPIYRHSELVRFRLLRFSETTLTPKNDNCQLTIKVCGINFIRFF